MIKTSRFSQFKIFIRKNIWADFLFTFIIYLGIQLIFNLWRSEDRSFYEILFMSAGFSLFMTPFFRMIRPSGNEGLDRYDTVDHVRHYKTGQRPQLKSYLQSCGYEVDYNDGAFSFFKLVNKSSMFSTQTFLHETDHWIALVGKPEILEQVPASIVSIYPQNGK